MKEERADRGSSKCEEGWDEQGKRINLLHFISINKVLAVFLGRVLVLIKERCTEKGREEVQGYL